MYTKSEVSGSSRRVHADLNDGRVLSDGLKVLELLFSGGLAQALEMPSILLHQFKGRALLHNATLVHDKDLGARHDGLLVSHDHLPDGKTHSKPMGNDQDSHALELLMYDSRDLGVGSRIDTGGSFIQDKELVMLEQSSGHHHQLFLTCRKTALSVSVPDIQHD
jgi:hypothetical protein